MGRGRGGPFELFHKRGIGEWREPHLLEREEDNGYMIFYLENQCLGEAKSY